MSVDHLWAPWRLEYIKKQGDKDSGCPFCELPKETPSAENLVLFKNDRLFVIMNKFPYNPGHLLVIPRAHVRQPKDLEPGVWQELSTAIQAAMSIVDEALKPQGFNVGINLGSGAGAGIPDHLHWHIVPRWNGDTNFMPVIAETKAIPTHNATVYRQLEKFFSKFAEQLL